MIEIRTASIDDLDEISKLELDCFPKAEAAKKEDFEKRLLVYPNHFLLIFEDEKLVALIDGFCTNEKDLTDEMYENASLHDENGDWQMTFGIITHPEFRKKGYAVKLIKEFIKKLKCRIVWE